MVLVDSSVWIDYFNGTPGEHCERLDELLDGGLIVVGDLILVEVLQGFRSDADFRKARELLAAFPCETLGGEEIALEAARNYRRLRSKGVTVRKTIDVIIATACLERGHALLHNDRDFDVMERWLGLAVAR